MKIPQFITLLSISLLVLILIFPNTSHAVNDPDSDVEWYDEEGRLLPAEEWNALFSSEEGVNEVRDVEWVAEHCAKESKYQYSYYEYTGMFGDGEPLVSPEEWASLCGMDIGTFFYIFLPPSWIESFDEAYWLQDIVSGTIILSIFLLPAVFISLILFRFRKKVKEYLRSWLYSIPGEGRLVTWERNTFKAASAVTWSWIVVIVLLLVSFFIEFSTASGSAVDGASMGPGFAFYFLKIVLGVWIAYIFFRFTMHKFVISTIGQRNKKAVIHFILSFLLIINILVFLFMFIWLVTTVVAVLDNVVFHW